jgi:hypothetical protein
VPRKQGDARSPEQIPEDERDYYLERKYPSFGNLVPRDVASRNAKQMADDGRGVGETGLAVYLDFKDAIHRIGPEAIKEKYGNLFQMYQKITDEDPYKVPMRIYPAIHYTMGGLWVDYNLMSTVPGLHVLGEANFSDHGANRLGASALMQGLADGYFVIPYTIGDYLASSTLPKVSADHDAFKDQETADYVGTKGVKMSSFVRRAAFALAFLDYNVLGSGAITHDSQMLWVRGVEDRLDNILNADAHGSDRIYDAELALKKDGSLWAWGKNNFGQMGDLSGFTPFQVGTAANWGLKQSAR